MRLSRVGGEFESADQVPHGGWPPAHPCWPAKSCPSSPCAVGVEFPFQFPTIV
jgi:hypothetical protein